MALDLLQIACIESVASESFLLSNKELDEFFVARMEDLDLSKELLEAVRVTDELGVT